MRTTWKWVALAGTAAVTLGCPAHPRDGRPGDHDGSGKDAEHLKMCAQKHPPFSAGKQVKGSPNKYGAPPAAMRAAAQPLVTEAAPQALAIHGGGGDCPDSGCGLNGTWLGAGVPFRTLHLSRFRHNDVNLSILDFQGPPPAGSGQGKSLTLQVDGDVLHAEGERIVQPGSTLLLGPPEWPSGPANTETYKLTIKKVREVEFWVQNDCPSCVAERFPVYDFEATSLSDNCPVQVCEPGLDAESDRTNNLIGTAVIFRGDYYDESYSVRITPPSTYDDDVFNIACSGTTLSKMHRLRHTTAAAISPQDPPAPPVDRRQALLRMFTADYCGAGQAFTHDGVPLQFGFDPAMGFGSAANPNPRVKLTTASLFGLTAFGATSLEAMWTADGATCIGTPRLLGQGVTMDDIVAACRLVGRTVTTCPAVSGTVSPPYPQHSYLTSQNP
jgi:hypothetical protein